MIELTWIPEALRTLGGFYIVLALAALAYALIKPLRSATTAKGCTALLSGALLLLMQGLVAVLRQANFGTNPRQEVVHA